MIIIDQCESGYHVISTETSFEIEECEAFGKHGYNVVAVVPEDGGHDDGGRWSMGWYTDREQAERVVKDCVWFQNLKELLQTYQFPIDMPGAYTGGLESFPEYDYNPYYDRYHPKTMGYCKNCPVKKYGVRETADGSREEL